MARKRFVIELGFGADLHGADMTKACVRAVRDAVSRSCLCGLVEVHGRGGFEGVFVHADLGVPDPGAVDRQQVLAAIPIGEKSVAVHPGGLRLAGLEVPCFGPGVSDIVVACAGVTVSVDEPDGHQETPSATTSRECLAGNP
ncbi:MAG: Lin0512 family protein [Solidesulfovibrio sp. DCME]|uniref:Lin0512 family protein n=1 Tax=Solidesulfovibrio sp. DCME TaxID=3447380 RepID=UPI003D0D80B8